MGRMNADSFAESVQNREITIDTALSWHLSSNHYPPIPAAMIEPCKLAIAAGNDGEYDRLIDIPEEVGTHRVYGQRVPAHAIIEHAHLDSFIEQEDFE